jgi:hypothetical protein
LAFGKEAFAECFFILGKEVSLPSVFYLTLGKAFFVECRGFAECFLFGSRQSILLLSARKKTLGKASGARQRSGFR